MGTPGLPVYRGVLNVGADVLMERYCPDCGVVLAAGRAQCHACYLRAQALTQCATERAWMARNFPGFRPRDLFPEDGWDEQEKQVSEKEVRGWRG